MENKKNRLVIPLTIVMVFTVASVTFAQEGGIFTLTDIPSRFNGKYVFIEAYDCNVDLIGFQSIDIAAETITLPRISDGRVNIPMWFITDDDNIKRYNGNQTNVEVEVFIFDSTFDIESIIAAVYFESVSFSNGNATISFRENDGFDED